MKDSTTRVGPVVAFGGGWEVGKHSRPDHRLSMNQVGVGRSARLAVTVALPNVRICR